MQRLGFFATLTLAVLAGWLVHSAKLVPTDTGLGFISVPAGFQVELAVKPGLVNYPMLGTLDDQGRLYLCESSGKTVKTPEMSSDPTYVVSMLEDTDGDGVFDKSTVFADKLTLPAGAVWYQGSLYVAAPPRLYKFTDTNGDGVADLRETIVEGWNLSANAASLHGPIMGPDGMLYLTDGRHGFNINTKDGKHFEGKASRIWRVHPDGTGLEVLAGGGFDNPVEVAFTEAGDVFGTMTYFTDPRDGMRDSILHYVEGGVYPKPYMVTEEFPRTGELMPVMTKFARIAPSGLLRYRGSSYGQEFQGNLFTAQFNSHRVQRHVVTRDGATFKTLDTDFFTAKDPDMHPTDVMEDADGSMLVVDTGAWFIHGCPLSKVGKPDVKGSLYRVRRKGALVNDPRGAKIDWKSADLGTLLDDARPAVVDRAVELMVERKVAQVKPKTMPGAAAAVSAKLGDTQPKVRKAALIALDQMEKSTLTVDQLLPLLSDNDAQLRRSAIWVASRHPAWSGRLSAALISRLRAPQLSNSEAESLGDAIAAFCDDAGMRRSLGAALGDGTFDGARQGMLLDAAERCSTAGFPQEWKSGLGRLLAHPDAAVRVAAIGLLRARGVPDMDAELDLLASDKAQSDDVRVAALSALSGRQPLRDGHFAFLIGKLLPSVEAAVKLAAGQVLGRSHCSDIQMAATAKTYFAKADALVLPNVLDVFRNGGGEEVGADLVKALEVQEAALGTVGMDRVKQVLDKFPATVREQAAPLVKRMAAAKVSRLEKLKKLEGTLTAQGNSFKGRELFFGAKTGCSSCHTIGLEGGHVGPDLTSIGAIRSSHDLLEAIVLPSESFVPGHEVYRVETAKEMYSGVLGKSTPDAVRLITGPGDEVRIPRKEIVKMGFAAVSLMPEGFDEVLSRVEMTDLLAYLRGQTGRPGN